MKLLLNAYYEALYERLESNRGGYPAWIEQLLVREIERRDFGKFDEEKLAAYAEASLAFIEERIESYNPIGIQYTFAPASKKEAFELEAQLDWYDSRAEFEALCAAARVKVQPGMSAGRMAELADELIRECGAYPDRSIIAGYEAQPALRKLPDYIAALVIEQTVRAGS